MFTMKVVKGVLITLLVFGINLQISFAQFTISAQVPAAGLITKSQLWNLLVINQSGQTVNAKIQMSLQDPQTRQVLLTGVTGMITIAPGNKVIQYQQAQPVEYNYPGGNIDRNPAGYLPVGNYQVCYQLTKFLHESSDELAEDCIDIEVEPMSPPLLSSPEDQSVSDYLRPSFTWLPPTPSGMFFNLNYNFILSPIHSGQSATEAIQYNLPVYSTGSLTQNFLQYPSGTPALDSGKTYAWQIVAVDQARYAAKSEVWSFTCKKDSAAIIVNSAPYVKITNQLSAPSFAYQGILKAEYNHPTHDSAVKVSIATVENPGRVLATFTIKVKYGQNFWVYDLNRKIHLKESQCYEGRISARGQQDFSWRFYPRYYKK